jgi:hypothetical protein
MIVLLGLSMLACSLGSEANIQSGNVLFQDDFSDPSSGWDRVNTDEGITDYANGVYRIFVNTDNTDVWANPDLSFTDTIIEVDATKTGGPDDNDFGLICRYEDSANFYFFIISSDGFYAVGKVIDGVQELLGDTEMNPNDAIKIGNMANNIRVDCVGSSLSLSVNGTQLVTVQDSSFYQGDVGLIAGTFDDPGTDIHFDNFVVRQP